MGLSFWGSWAERRAILARKGYIYYRMEEKGVKIARPFNLERAIPYREWRLFKPEKRFDNG